MKATFSIVLATTSFLMIRHLRHDGRRTTTIMGESAGTTATTPPWLPSPFSEGSFRASRGPVRNIVVFLFLVVLAGVGPKVALPTAIIVMTAVSIVGFVLFGLIDGQLDVAMVDDRVVAVGGKPVGAAIADGRSDLLGLWLAAIPVVVWGAPLGALAASIVAERHLVRFVAFLAAVEVATTVVLVPELRSEGALIAYLILGLAALPAAFVLGQRYRSQLFGETEPHDATGAEPMLTATVDKAN